MDPAARGSCLGVAAYRFRVPLLAKVLGQPQSRIDRQLNRRKR